MTIEQAKKAAGEKAASLIEAGQIVGLGTGSTARYFIEALGERVSKGLSIKAVASSKASEELAKELGIPLQTLEEIPWIDVTVDGADEIDPEGRMIKGGGGAHVREKIVASLSHQMYVIVDETKLVAEIGQGKLPLEILPFGAEATRKKIEALGYRSSFRVDAKGEKCITDNGGYLLDLAFESPPEDPEKVEALLRSIPGLVDTGFFFGYASLLLIGYKNGLVEQRTLDAHPRRPHRANL